jgi:hypothetical protein
MRQYDTSLYEKPERAGSEPGSPFSADDLLKVGGVKRLRLAPLTGADSTRDVIVCS